jgi:hypothetical protein
METPNTQALGRQLVGLGMRQPEITRVFRTFNAWAEPFRAASEAYEKNQDHKS